MMTVRCPHCMELRHERELLTGGEADCIRPADPADVSDAAWTDYLYLRDNVRGVHRELWCCDAGCGQWFHVVRDTATHIVIEATRLATPSAGKVVR